MSLNIRRPWKSVLLTAICLLLPSLASAASPDAFTFVVRNNVATNAIVTSESKTITGSGSFAVSVTQADGAQYSVAGGAYTSAPGTITAGQALRVRHVSSVNPNVSVTTVVTVGGYTTNFQSVTGSVDRTPDAFGFDTQNNVEPGVKVRSNALTLQGYNTSIPVVAGAGAEYSINGGAFTAVNGTLAVGQTLTLQHTSNSQFLGYTKTSVTVGGVTGYFTTRTRSSNTPPTISGIPATTTDEDTATGALAFTVGDVESNPATLTVTATSGNSELVAAAGLALGGSGASRTLTLTPAANASGSAAITVTVSDGAATASTSFTLTVNPVNDAPQAYDDGFSTDEDTFASNLDVLHNDVDADSALAPTSVTILAQGHGVATVNADGSVNFLPDANFYGDASFSYTVADTQGARSQPATANVFVRSVDDAPVAQGSAFTINEDTRYEGALAATDIDSSVLTFRVNAPALHGTATVNADGGYTYVPDANFNGPDNFRFVASDGERDSAPATVSITVNAMGEAIVSIGDASLNEKDAGTRTLDFPVTLSRAPDGGSATLHYEIVDVTTTHGQDYSGASSGTVTFSGGATSRTISVTVVNDSADEPDAETLRVLLSAPSASAEIGNGVATGTIVDDDTSNLLHIGAAKRSIVPTQAQINGIVEERAFGGGEHLQKFNLGGFGINIGQNLADPAGDIPAQATTTEPATRRVFRNKAGQDENTNLRLFAVEKPGGTVVVFVMADAIGAGNLIQAGVKNAIVAAAAAQGVTVAPDNILFGLTHSHAAADLQGLWGGVPQDWIVNVLYKAAGDAATEAFATRRPAHLSYRQGYTSAFNNYRRPRIDPNADADGTITLLSAIGDDGTPVGSLLQYNAHPTSVGDDNKPRTPHSEYILGAMDWIESHEGGTSLYFNGPIADASPEGQRPGCANREAGNPDPSANEFGYVRCRGEGIADYLLHSGNVISSHELAPTLSSRSVQVVLPITNPAFLAAAGAGSFNRYYNFAELPVDKIPGLTPTQINDLPQVAPVAVTTVSRITLGGADTGLEVVSVPGETTNTYGNYIRGLAKTKVMLLGLTHNSFGYILPEEEFSYVAQDGDDGFVAPFTGYEESVSLGPLTATLLRIEGYNQLFNPSPEKNVPPAVLSCTDSSGPTTCALIMAEERINLALASIQACAGNGLAGRDPATGTQCPLIKVMGYFEEGCQAFTGEDPDDPAYRDGTCYGLTHGGAGPLGLPGVDARLLQASADAQLRGCDMLDPAECLFPFPSDWFTVKAGDGSPQSVASGGTGKRINFSLLAMPRNVEGKPIDPTEWNRQDGFSPGQLIITYVPGIGAVKGPDGKPLGPINGAVPLTDLARYADEDAPILVLDADTGERHPIYAEIDLNAGYLLPMQGFGPRTDKQPALLIRPAKNFLEGHRYVVVLRNLKNDYGQPIPAGPAFSDCRDRANLGAMPAVQERCDQLSDKVFPVLSRGGIARDRSLYLAWDFTVASAKNDTARIVAMRDDAFASLGDTRGSAPGDAGYPAGRAPTYVVTQVTENPDGADGKTVRRVQGTLTVPSYVTPADPAPLANDARFRSFADTVRQNQPDAFNTLRGMCNDSGADPLGVVCDVFDPAGSTGTARGLSLPPNRLNFVPDGKNPCAGLSPAEIATSQCAMQARWGNGKPVRSPTGDMTTTFTCNIPRSAVSGAATMDPLASGHATVDQVQPVRPTLYGHGLLGGQGEGNGQASDWGNRYGFMVCAADWFGFASGDLGTVAAALVDLSSFAAVPDGSQQGYLNQMFLARLAVHPDGFAADPRFQVQGKPVFDRREVFYDGNSQGGIMGGALVAMSKDINRGVLGVLGMNYSTLLARSTDFALYSVPLYLSYQGDLQRPEVMSLMQMLWDRSENNGYAEHLTDNSAMGGPDNRVLMTPAFGDHQVTMYSADVMARTIGAGVDRGRVTDARKLAAGLPLTAEGEIGLPTLDYSNPDQTGGSALVYYDEQWLRADGDRCNANTRTAPPPIGNLPPNADNLGAGAPLEDPSIVHNRGSDPHECPRRDPQARCQMSHFLQRTNVAPGDTAATLIDPALQSRSDDTYGGGCPAVVRTGAPETGGTPAGLSTLDQFTAALQAFIDAVKAGDPAGAGTALQDAATLAVAYVTETATGAGDTVLALVTGTDASAPDGVWLKGDLHVHDDHSSDGSFTRQTIGQGSPGDTSVSDQIGFAEAQGLDFLPLTDHRTYDQHYDPLWTSAKLLLVTGEEANSSPHATVFGALDMINQNDSESDLRTLQQSIWDAHGQGAAWSTAHPDDGETASVNDDGTNFVPNARADGTGVDLAEIWNRGTLNRPKVAYVENRWNHGFRFGLAGASDNHFKEIWAIAGPGTPMTHVLAAEKSTPALLDALHAGRTVINMGNTRSPFVTLTGDFDGDGKFETVGGDERSLAPGRTATLRVTVENGAGTTVNVYRAPGYYAGAAAFQSFTPLQPKETFEFTIAGGKAQDWYRVEVRGPGEPDAADYARVTGCGDITDFPPKPAVPRLEPSKCQPQTAADSDPNALRAVTAAIFVSASELAKPESPNLPLDAGAPDGAQLLFGDAADNAFAGFADLAVANGTVHAVAEVRSGHKSHVLYRARLVNGTLTAPFDLSPASGLARQPAIAASGSDVWVAWQDERGTETPHRSNIYLRHSADGGASWGNELQVSASTARALRPDIALVAASQPVVVWEDNSGGAFDVLARVIGADAAPVNLSASGKTVMAANPYDTRSARYPASVSPKVAVRADGVIAVAWQDNRLDADAGWTGHDTAVASITSGKQPQAAGTQTDDWEILAAVRGASGWGAPRNVSQSSTQADRHAAIAFDADGALHAAWDSKRNNGMAGPRLEIREKGSSDLGVSWGALRQVTRADDTPPPDVIPGTTAQRPAYGRNGDALSLLWTDGSSADWRWRIARGTTAATVTGAGNAGWASYDNGFLAFTSDRAATREQRKPQQVWLLALDAPAAEIPAGTATLAADADGDGLTAKLDFDGAPPGTPALSLTDGQALGAAVTVYQRGADGGYAAAANHLVTLVFEVDCGGQADPLGRVPCNSNGKHIARSSPRTTDGAGKVVLSLPWEANEFGSGLRSLFGSAPVIGVHAMLVDIVGPTNNRVMNYSPAGQLLVAQAKYDQADAADNAQFVPVLLTHSASGGSGTPDDNPPPVHGLAGCVATQDPAMCQAAFESLQDLQGCSYDQAGFNCAFNIVYDAVGVDTAAGAIQALVQQCYDSPLGHNCNAVRSVADTVVPDAVDVLSQPLARGDLRYTDAADASPSVKTVDGNVDDWMGEATRIGGTDLYEFGESIYSDFLFDAYGADNGEDARRLAVLGLLGDVSNRTERLDALQQAAGDQLDVPQPAGSKADHYGDSTDREDGTDLTEVRWAADGEQLYFLARVAMLQSADNLVTIVLADTGAGVGMQGLNAGLSSKIFDRAFVLRRTGSTVINLLTGTSTSFASQGGSVAVNASGYVNALEAGIPRSLLERADGKIKVAVLTARVNGTAFIPANLAYRFDEPVSIYSEHAQALALFGGNLDAFAKTIALADLTRGRTQTARPDSGYHERQFISGSNISVESDSEEGQLQPYGMYVPKNFGDAPLASRMTIWTHYRGGKAHSGAAWTPRLFRELGDDHDNIVVSPRGRGTSTWYTTRAHQDFFEVFADVAGTGALKQYAAENLPADHRFGAQGLLTIDPAHVYISGYSMGGFATYLFSGLYPDLFAGGFTQSGAVTQGAWTGIGPDPGAPGTEVCPYRAPDSFPEVGGGTPCFIEANEGRANAQLNWRILDNTRYVPIEINHGTNDELALTPGAQRMGERLLELGYRYDMMSLLGYEHFTQAIMDEWADGAQYINRFARPENPRLVSYKVVPALVKAVNEVQLKGYNDNQPFHFNPDGAYWVDGLVVRDGADGADPTKSGQIVAESGRLAGSDHVTVPRSGTDVDRDSPANSWASSPVYSPGHTTPFIRTGLDWVDTLPIAGEANTFSATLTNLSAARLDTARMKLDFTRDVEATITIAQFGAVTNPPVQLTLDGAPTGLCVENRSGPGGFDFSGTTLAFTQDGTYVLAIRPGCALFQAALRRFQETTDETGAPIIESTGEMVSVTHLGSSLSLNAVSASGVPIAPARFDTRFDYRFLGAGCQQFDPRVQILWKRADGSDQPSPGNLRGVVIGGPVSAWTEFRYSANTDEAGRSPPDGATALAKIRLIMEAKVRDTADQAPGDCRMQLRNARVYDGERIVYRRYASASIAARAPDAAGLCASYGVPNGEPLCAQLRNAETQLRQQCENRGAPGESCTLSGGNLHALLDTCYQQTGGDAATQRDGLPAPACRVVDALAGGIAAYCRGVSGASSETVRPELCAMIGGTQVAERAIEQYETSWVHQALALQNRLGYGQPLVNATLLHTHNSFNATTNNTPATPSGSDYNQLYSIPQQLRMDIRAIEMDVHWMPGRDAKPATNGREPMLCHGLNGGQANAGCTTERPLRKGLEEFRDWLDAHPGETVLLYIEDDIVGTQPASDLALAYATTAQVIEAAIGNRVYRPAAHGSTCGNNQPAGADSSSWLNVSRQAMLDAGKQVLLITETCAGSGWDALFHQKIENRNWKQGTQGSYANIAYPQCAADDAGFIIGNRGQRWTRVWEDSTVVTATGAEAATGGKFKPGGPAAITPKITRELMRCGLSLPGFDRLDPADGRLEAAVWSWAEHEPAASSTLNCAALNNAGRFFAADCADAKPFACAADGNPTLWQVAGAGAWSDGAMACPAGYHFSVPASGYQDEQLKAAAQGAEVWLDYSDAQAEGQWSGDATPAPGGPGSASARSTGLDALCRNYGGPEMLCSSLAAVSQALAPVIGPDPHPFAAADPVIAQCRASGVPEMLCSRAEDLAENGGLSRWVDPRIGSHPPGFTNPGPFVPYGMVQPGPDTEGPIVYGGYYSHNSLITGFSHVHMSAGVYKGGYIPVMPFTGALTTKDNLFQGQDHPVPAYASSFDHASETAEAGYYAVNLSRYGVSAELTATPRAGLHRYTFNDPAQPARVLIDVSRSLEGYRDGSVRVSNGVISGRVHSNNAGGFEVYFAARTDQPFTATTISNAVLPAAGTSGASTGVILDFAGKPQKVMVKLALSYTDEAGALANLDSEIPGWDFAATRAAARSAWDRALASIEVEGGTLADRTSFYTALYHLQQFPNLHSDVDGRYLGPDRAVHAADGHDHYSQFSSWDSYRGQNQMQAEIVPALYKDMVRSLLAFHEQARYLPRWQEGPRDASHMSGDPIIPFIGEAWCRGQLDGALRAKLWPALTNLVVLRDPDLARLGYLPVPPADLQSQVAGYLPFDIPKQVPVTLAGHSSRAGTTLEYGIADFSLALMAQDAAPAEAGAIASRSLNYRNLQDADGWIHPKDANGGFIPAFRPELSYGFQEGTSWQYSWLAMHDYAGVIDGMAGDSAVNNRLDQFFGSVLGDAPIAWPTVQSAITAFGTTYAGNQYVPGNEHDLQAPYVYNYTGVPWKAQIVSRAAASIYTPTTTGLPGNDDLGALSGWLVWAMSGIYPMNPGTPLAVIGSPVFEKVTIKRPTGNLVIEAPGTSAANKFVQSLAINGVTSPRSWFVIPRTATTVRIDMGPLPNTAWGADIAARPPSISTGALADFGCRSD